MRIKQSPRKISFTYSCEYAYTEINLTFSYSREYGEEGVIFLGAGG